MARGFNIAQSGPRRAADQRGASNVEESRPARPRGMRFNCMRLALPSAKHARKKRTRNRISSGISRRQQLPQSRTWPQADAEDSSITIDGSSHQTSPIPLPHAICVCLISFFLPPGLGGRAVSVALFPPRVCFRGRRGIVLYAAFEIASAMLHVDLDLIVD